MNRKGENSFNQEDEKAKYEVGMDVFLKDKEGKIIYLNEHYITIQFDDGIKESFIWHELFDKYEDVVTEDEEADDVPDDLTEEDLEDEEEEVEKRLEDEGLETKWSIPSQLIISRASCHALIFELIMDTDQNPPVAEAPVDFDLAVCLNVIRQNPTWVLAFYSL